MNAQRMDTAPVKQPKPAQFTTAPAHPQEPGKPQAPPSPTTLDRPHDDHVHVDEPGYGHGV
jgi:hypothetical protein